MSNEYFQPGSVPAPNSPGSSAVMRNEFSSIASGFDKLPVLAGHADELVAVNATGTALTSTGAALGDYVTKDGVFTLTNKTIAWADNTFPGFGTGATKNAGSAAGEVPVLAGASLLPVLDGSLLTNLNVNQAGTIVDIAHGGTGANTYAGAQAALGINLKADANNAVLTGAPTAPHPPTGDGSARIATTFFVQETVTAIGGFGPGNAVPQMNGPASPGVSTLGARDDHVHPTDTSRAPSAAGTAVGTSFTPAGGIAATDVQGALQELDAEKANLVSPVFSGDPRSPTPTAGDNDTSIATTAFVQTAITPLAPLASPTFTGDPRAPTTATSDNDTSIATTAFVQSLLAQQPPGIQVSNSTPLINGVAAPGTGVEASRYDHVHPVDTSRAPASAATATGTSFTPVGGVAATNVQAAIAELDTEKAPALAGVPSGAIMDFAMTAVPAGWLQCDGAAVSRTTYAALFAAIGTTWGVGDGSTTFNLPDVRGRYRAMGGTDGTAASKTFGQKLGDAIRNITGSTSAVYRAVQISATGALSMSAYGSTPAKVGDQGVDPGDSVSINFDASGSVPTANENRPYSIVVQTCIKV